MDLLALLSQVGQLLPMTEELKAKVAEAEAAASELAQLKYDEGFAAGVASVTPPASEKIFTQEELDAKIQEALSPLQTKIADLENVVANQDAVIAQKVEEGIAAFKVKVKEAFLAQQASETQSESELLKIFE